MHVNAAVQNGRAGELLTAAPLYSVFALTGFGTALLGAVLPALLLHWKLTDANAGVLFLLLFVASSLGSLLQHSHDVRVAAVGAASIACGSGLLLQAQGLLVFAATALLGFGLGVCISTITRVRLLCPPNSRTREVNRLNLVWGLGAFACPSVASLLMRHGGVRTLFLCMALASGAAAVAVLLPALRVAGSQTYEEVTGEGSFQVLPWPAAAAAFLAVGLEAALGSWLATYTRRVVGSSAAPVEATTLFWLGLLLSRALMSLRGAQRLSHARAFGLFTVMVTFGCAVLLGSNYRTVVLCAAALLGFGVGPLFPMLLAAVLPQVRGNLIFVIAGTGSAVLPWLTGECSQRFGSLRVGLVAPVAAGVALLLMLAPLSATFGRLTPAWVDETAD